MLDRMYDLTGNNSHLTQVGDLAAEEKAKVLGLVVDLILGPREERTSIRREKTGGEDERL